MNYPAQPALQVALGSMARKPVARPILFSGAMVRGILEGRKGQTRRVIKPQPPAKARDAGVIWSLRDEANGQWCWLDSADFDEASFLGDWFRCPYGVEGDHLWVRETWKEATEFMSEATGPKDVRFAASVSEAEWATTKWRSSIHMPRWASRITLKVTRVRIKRLHEITEEQSVAEGVEHDEHGWKLYNKHLGKAICAATARQSYISLWDQINGKGAWNENPWVWAVAFERAPDFELGA